MSIIALRRANGRRALAGATLSALILGPLCITAAAATPAAPSAEGPTIGGYTYLKNFRTTHLSGRFVTPDGKPITHAAVYAALDGLHAPAHVAQRPIVARAVTDGAGTFALAIPKNADTLAYAATHHGDVNLVLRATSDPFPNTPAAASAPANGGQSAAQLDVGSCVQVPDNGWFCPPPPAPTPDDAVDTAEGGPQAGGGYSALVANWAVALADPFNQYPQKVLATVAQTENLTLVAAKAQALMVPQTTPCATCVQAQSDPSLATFGLNATDAAWAFASMNSGDGNCETTYQQWTYQTNWEPLSDMHAGNDTTVVGEYWSNLTSNVGVAFKQETQNGNGSWQVDGSTNDTANAYANSGSFGPNIGTRLDAQTQFVQYHEADDCKAGNGREYWEYWDEIGPTAWTGGLDIDGSNLTQYDGQQEYNNYSEYGGSWDHTGHGGGIAKQQGKGYKYSWEVSAFGVTLGSETDWDNNLKETWTFGHQPYWHHLFGHDNPPASATLVFAW